MTQPRVVLQVRAPIKLNNYMDFDLINLGFLEK